jgi:hypothetical protein
MKSINHKTCHMKRPCVSFESFELTPDHSVERGQCDTKATAVDWPPTPFAAAHLAPSKLFMPDDVTLGASSNRLAIDAAPSRVANRVGTPHCCTTRRGRPASDTCKRQSRCCLLHLEKWGLASKSTGDVALVRRV